MTPLIAVLKAIRTLLPTQTNFLEKKKVDNEFGDAELVSADGPNDKSSPNLFSFDIRSIQSKTFENFQGIYIKVTNPAKNPEASEEAAVEPSTGESISTNENTSDLQRQLEELHRAYETLQEENAKLREQNSSLQSKADKADERKQEIKYLKFRVDNLSKRRQHKAKNAQTPEFLPSSAALGRKP